MSKRYGNRFYNRISPDGADVTAMTSGSEGQYFYIADTKGRVLRGQSDNAARGYKLIWSGEKVIRVMTMSPDASWLACGTETSEIIMIPITDDTIGYQMQDSCGSITALLFSPGGERLYSSAIKGGVNEWDLTLPPHHPPNRPRECWSGVLNLV